MMLKRRRVVTFSLNETRVQKHDSLNSQYVKEHNYYQSYTKT